MGKFNYRDTRLTCELFRLKDPSLAEDPCAHPNPEVEVVEEFKVHSFEEAADHVMDYRKSHPGHVWYYRPKREPFSHGLMHDDGVCSWGLGPVDNFFVDLLAKCRIELRKAKRELDKDNPFRVLDFQSQRVKILRSAARIRKMSKCGFVRKSVKVWLAICDWCGWYLKDKWIELWKSHKWEREQLAYWKKNHHDASEHWSLDMHLLKDLKWNLDKLVKESYSINSEFIKDILVEEHGNDPGFNLEDAMRNFHMGQGCEDIERRAVERQNETYLRICHLVDLYTFYLWQDIDDEDAYTSPKRTEDMKSILMECTYDMLDYKAMFDKSVEVWNEIWDLVKRYGQQMGD